jgi:hypothetical protein
LALRHLGQQVPVLLHVRRQPPHLEKEEKIQKEEFFTTTEE